MALKSLNRSLTSKAHYHFFTIILVIIPSMIMLYCIVHNNDALSHQSLWWHSNTIKQLNCIFIAIVFANTYMLMHSSFGQLCCYDDEGSHITTNGPAGSAYFYSPTKHYLQHLSSDYFPYKACCINANHHSSCTKYYSKRPKDSVNGTSCTLPVPNRGVLCIYLRCRL